MHNQQLPESRIAFFCGVITLLLVLLIASETTGGAQQVQNAPPHGSGAHSLPAAYSGGPLLVDVQVNGRPASFLLDTGCSGNIIDAGYVRKYGIPIIPRRHKLFGLKHDGVVLDLAVSMNLQISVSGFDAGDKETLVLDLSKMKVKGVDGVLGKPFFLKHAVSIDYASQQAYIDDPAQEEGGSVFELEKGHWAYLTATIETPDGKTQQGRFFLDTGSDASFDFNEWFAKKHAAAFVSRSPELDGRMAGIDGDQFTYDNATLHAIQVAGKRWSNLAVRISGSVGGKKAERPQAGVVGNSFLKNYLVTIDYPHLRLVLKEKKPEAQIVKASEQ